MSLSKAQRDEPTKGPTEKCSVLAGRVNYHMNGSFPQDGAKKKKLIIIDISPPPNFMNQQKLERHPSRLICCNPGLTSRAFDKRISTTVVQAEQKRSQIRND